MADGPEGKIVYDDDYWEGVANGSIIVTDEAWATLGLAQGESDSQVPTSDVNRDSHE